MRPWGFEVKTNRIPLAIRLQRRIAGLERLIEGGRAPMDKIHHSRGNPYWGCRGCGRADPQLSVDGHSSYCRFKSLEGEVRYYRDLLATLKEKA